MDIKIRKIEEGDFHALAELFLEFAHFEKQPQKMTNSVEQMQAEKQFIHGFVATTANDEVIGYATCFYAYYTWVGKSLYMDDLYVKPEYRGQGVGTRLINEIVALAKFSKCKKVRWQVSQWNQPAIDFYESLGARIESGESNCDLLL